MALPVTIPNAFANATASIPLSQLDANFNTLANAVNGISDGSETLANVTATVGNITTVNATTVDTTNIEVTNIKAKDGTSAGSIADSTGVVTLASSVLTTTDINGGTIDGTAIGGASAAAGSFTTLNTSGQVVFNDAGADVDFRVEGDTDANLLFVDAGNDAVLLGSATTTNNLRLTEKLAIVHAGQDTYVGMAITGYSGTGVTARPIIDFQRSRGTTDGSMTKVESGDSLGSIVFRGSDGTSFQDSAMISAEVDNPTGSGDMPGRLTFSTSPDGSSGLVGRMVIDSSGYVRVNNTSGIDGQLSSLTDAWYAGAFANTSVAYPTVYSWSKATSGDNLFYQFFTETSAVSRGSIDYNRGAALTRYNTTSDATLKNIIGDSDGAKSVEILNSTRIREFAWKDDETQKTQIGVIAQELYKTYKGAVSVGGDVEKERDVTEEVEEEYTDENGETQTRTVTKVVGKETYTEYRPWAVDKTAFTFHLVAGWQAHEKLIKQQAETIVALEARIAALEGN